MGKGRMNSITVTFVWQEKEGETLKDCFLEGVSKGIADLVNPEMGLLQDLDLGRNMEGDVVYVTTNPDTKVATAVGSIVVGEIDVTQLEEAEAKILLENMPTGGSVH